MAHTNTGTLYEQPYLYGLWREPYRKRAVLNVVHNDVLALQRQWLSSFAAITVCVRVYHIKTWKYQTKAFSFVASFWDVNGYEITCNQSLSTTMISCTDQLVGGTLEEDSYYWNQLTLDWHRRMPSGSSAGIFRLRYLYKYKWYYENQASHWFWLIIYFTEGGKIHSQIVREMTGFTDFGLYTRIILKFG
jgi:hypothetical protein